MDLLKKEKDNHLVIFVVVIIAVFLLLTFILLVMKPVWEARKEAEKQETEESITAKEINDKIKVIEERRIEKKMSDPRTDEEIDAEIEANLKAIEERRNKELQ